MQPKYELLLALEMVKSTVSPEIFDLKLTWFKIVDW